MTRDEYPVVYLQREVSAPEFHGGGGCIRVAPLPGPQAPGDGKTHRGDATLSFRIDPFLTRSFMGAAAAPSIIAAR